MKRAMFLLLTVSALLAVSCNEDISPDTSDVSEELTLTIRVRSDAARTRANDVESVPASDGLHRLDLYIYHYDEPLLDTHITLEPDPSGTTVYSIKEKKDETVGIIAIGNLDADTAQHLEGKTLDQMANYTDPHAWIVLSANNFALDRIVMVGAMSYNFTKDGTAEIELRRLMYRIDIGKITVSPTNKDLLGKEVFVKNIVLTNVCNYFVPLKNASIGYFYTWALFFGSEYNLTGALGGIEKGFRYYVNAPGGWSADGTFSMDGPGILTGDFPFMINSNYQKDPGVLNVDADGILKDITHHSYDNTVGEGLIVNSGDMTESHSINVGKCFYGFMGRGTFSNYSIVSEYKSQNIYPKIVIELSIDGQSWFYPIPLIYPQPNTIYKIDNITVRDYGSEYSNFYIQKYAVDFAITVSDWNELSVENMNVGADPVTGKPVDLYNE